MMLGVSRPRLVFLPRRSDCSIYPAYPAAGGEVRVLISSGSQASASVCVCSVMRDRPRAMASRS
jgi:hypothetical protein